MEQQPYRRPANRRRKRKNNAAKLTRLCLALFLVLLVLVLASTWLRSCGRKDDPSVNRPNTSQSTTPSGQSVPKETGATEPSTEPAVVREGSFTLRAMGDMLMHMPVVNTGAQGDGTYNFDSIFQYFADYFSEADYAAGNLETTLAGTDNGYAYHGYPNFNCPDAIIDGMKTAGFDLVLTSNNHCYDTRAVGLHRTLEVITDRGLDHLGTRNAEDEPTFLVVERNGIRLGIACYTYDTGTAAGYPGMKTLNGNLVEKEDGPLINSFDYKNLDAFYAELTESMDQMEEQGADAVVLFVHWGEEYQLKQNATQSAIAQKLCDLGVDVIIGGHPHVVQPVELLTSTLDETQKTVCLYSMGNAVSNQRLGNLTSINTAHTEDGACFGVTFTRYSDGTVILEKAELLPTWVDLRTTGGKTAYCILPLDKQIEDWKTQFALTDNTLKKAEESYARTMAIVGEGMTAVNDYLAQHTAQVEADLGVK